MTRIVFLRPTVNSTLQSMHDLCKKTSVGIARLFGFPLCGHNSLSKLVKKLLLKTLVVLVKEYVRQNDWNIKLHKHTLLFSSCVEKVKE